MYAKLFTSIYQGTLRGNSHGLLVFTNLLAHADSAGHVDVHPRAIAEEVGLTVDQVRAALDVLEAPDEESRSPECDGRRIVRLDDHRAWGWRVVNYVKYRSIRSEEDRREQNRMAQAKWRNKQESAERKQDKPRKPPSAHTEAEAEAYKKKEGATAPPALRLADLLAEGVEESHATDWLKVRKTKRAPLTQTAWDGLKREASKAGLTVPQAVKLCAERNWQALNAEWITGERAPSPAVDAAARTSLADTQALLAKQRARAESAVPPPDFLKRRTV